MTIEYAWFLADTRGLGFALQYLDSLGVARALVTRAIGRPDLRRTRERRAALREDELGSPPARDVGDDGSHH